MQGTKVLEKARGGEARAGVTLRVRARKQLGLGHATPRRRNSAGLDIRGVVGTRNAIEIGKVDRISNRC